MLPELTDRLLGQWSRLFPGLGRPSSIRYMGLPGSVEGGTASFVAFVEGRRDPMFVVKVHREHGANERDGRERAILERLASCTSAISATVPRVLFSEEVRGRPMLVQSLLPGTPMTAPMQQSGLPDVRSADHSLSLVSDWLLILCRETRVTSVAEATAFEGEAEALIRTFVQTFDLLPAEQAFAEGLLETARLIGERMLSVQHGDFCRQNILTSPAGIRIIDWTDCIPLGSPMHDMLFFVTTYFLQARGARGISNVIRAFELSFWEENPYSDVVRRRLTSFSAHLGFEADAFVGLMGLFLVQQSVMEHRKMVRCSRSGLLPQFNTLLAPPEQITMQEAARQQIWVSMFRFFVGRRHSFPLALA